MNAFASKCRDQDNEPETVFDPLEAFIAKLNSDVFVKEHASHSQINELVNYLWSAQGQTSLSIACLEKHVTKQMSQYKVAHQKSYTKTMEAMKEANAYFADANFEMAIKLYWKAIQVAPHKQLISSECHLARLYGKRAICHFLTSALQEAEYDYLICATLDGNIGRQCLEKVLYLLENPPPTGIEGNHLLISSTVRKLQSERLEANFVLKCMSGKQDGSVRIPGNVLNLWFDNRAKGRRHPEGAHFLCAKVDLPLGSEVLQEKPVVCVSANVCSTCAGCSRPLEHSFWPCDTCDEVAFCSIACHGSSTHHKLECGLWTYFRDNLSPTGTILFHLYTRYLSVPEFSAKTDLVQRPSLSTDADLFFVGRENRAKLPKRSFQYRYFQLERNKKTLPMTHCLLPFETMLALRESADNKDELLPAIAPSKLVSSVLLEAIQLFFTFEHASTLSGFSLKSEVYPYSRQNKARFLGIVNDYCRLYRLNTAQGIQDASAPEGEIFFVQPVLGTFFWPACKPNVKMTFCRTTGTLHYHTTQWVQRREKLCISLPGDYIANRSLMAQPCECLSCVTKSANCFLSSETKSLSEITKTSSKSSLDLIPEKRLKLG